MDLNYKIKFDAKPEIIYSALITEDGLKSWMSEGASVGKVEGDTHYMVFQKEGNLRAVNFRIIDLEPNRKIVWSCLYSDNPIWPGTVITFNISDNGELDFVHQGLKDDSADKDLLEDLKNVWKYFLNNLKEYCETGETHPW